MYYRFVMEGEVRVPEGSVPGEAGTTIVLPGGQEIGPEPVLMQHQGGGIFRLVDDEEALGCETMLKWRVVERLEP